MQRKINLEIEKVLNGYILTLVSGIRIFSKNREELTERINEEIDTEVI